MEMGSANLPNCSQESVLGEFVKPAMTVIRHATGESKHPSRKKAKPVRALTVDQVLRLLDAAANSPAVLRWDPNR